MNVAPLSTTRARKGQPATDFPGAEFLHTRRMSLRGLRLADVAALTALNADPEVARWLLEPIETDYFGIAKVVFRANELYLARPGLGAWRADDDEGRFLGIFSLMPLEGSEEIEIGTRLNRFAWARLLAVEGGRALCAHAFTNLGLPRLAGLCHPRNVAVPAILRRLGFVANGEAQYHGKTALRFVLERQEWRKRQTVSLNDTGAETPAQESTA